MKCLIFVYLLCSCCCHDFPKENLPEKYLAILEELIEELENLLENVKSEIEKVAEKGRAENSTLSAVTDSPGVVDDPKLMISSPALNEDEPKTFSINGGSVGGENLPPGINSSDDSLIANFTPEPRFFNASSGHEQTVNHSTSLVFDYSPTNGRNNTTSSETPTSKNLANTNLESPGNIPASTVPYPQTNKSLTSLEVPKAELDSITPANVSKSRDTRSTTLDDGHDLSSKLEEILEAVKTELEESDLTENNILSLEKCIKEIKDFNNIFSDSIRRIKLNSTYIEFILKEANNMRKIIKLIGRIVDLNLDRMSLFGIILRKPVMLWGCVAVLGATGALILMMCLIIHGIISKLNKNLDKIQVQKPDERKRSVQRTTPQSPGFGPTLQIPEFEEKSNFAANMKRKSDLATPPENEHDKKAGPPSDWTTFGVYRRPKSPPRDYDSLSSRRFDDAQSFPSVISKVKFVGNY